MKRKQIYYVPCTPAGTPLIHLTDEDREKAINNLLEDAAHMPYIT